MADPCIISTGQAGVPDHHIPPPPPPRDPLLHSSPDSPRYRALDTSACRNSSGIGVGSSCLYQVSYGDGSFTVEDFATETLTLGDFALITSIAIRCGHDNEGLFVGATGLLALGGGPFSFPSQISAHSFSYCLINSEFRTSSTLELGDSAASGAAMATMMLSPPTSAVSSATSPSSLPPPPPRPLLTWLL